MASKYQIPFDDKGNQLHYPYYNELWRDNEEFLDTLTFKGYARGRSAAYFLFERESTGTQVTVFMTDFEKMVPHMNRGSITANFTYTKKGQNYGCKILGL